MRKLILAILVLTLAQAACNLPQAVPAQATPSLPTKSSTPGVLQTATNTPPVLPSQTNTAAVPPTMTATIEATLTSAPPTGTPSPSPTVTQTPDSKALFSTVTLSVATISLKCEPKSVQFNVTTIDPNVYSIVIFVRLRDKVKGQVTSWNDGFSLQPLGSGNFSKIIQASSIPEHEKFSQSWVQFQIVAIGKDKAIIGRSEVFGDRLTLIDTCS